VVIKTFTGMSRVYHKRGFKILYRLLRCQIGEHAILEKILQKVMI